MNIELGVRAMPTLCCALALACGRGAGDADTRAETDGAAPAAEARSERVGADRNACELLTEAEVGAAAGVPVTAVETQHETGRSDCSYFDGDSLFRFGIVAYWTGGKEGWDIMAASRGAASAALEREEGIGLDSVVKTGPVGGLGDKAFYGDLLPSLVLQGDVLLELSVSPLPRPAAQFRPLAARALARL
jgi:hypothetical protein